MQDYPLLPGGTTDAQVAHAAAYLVIDVSVFLEALGTEARPRPPPG